jgi:hypothetical protein
MEKLCFNEEVSTVTESTTGFLLNKNCNGYLAVNVGDEIVTVNNFPLKPPVLPTLSGESHGLAGNVGEVFKGTNGTISIVFAGGGSNPKVLIAQKYYV